MLATGASHTKLSPQLLAVAEALDALLQGKTKEEFYTRSGDFVKLDEALSCESMRFSIEQVARGSSANFSRSGYGGHIAPQLLSAVRAIVAVAPFELWDASVKDRQELWIRKVGDKCVSPEVEPVPTVASAQSSNRRFRMKPIRDFRLSDANQLESDLSWKQRGAPTHFEQEQSGSQQYNAYPSTPSANTDWRGYFSGAQAVEDETAPKQNRYRGTITTFFEAKGYGFLSCEAVSGEIFFHTKNIIGPLPTPVGGRAEQTPRQEMFFSLDLSKNRPRAMNASLITDDACADRWERETWASMEAAEPPDVQACWTEPSAVRPTTDDGTEDDNGRMFPGLVSFSKAMASLLRHRGPSEGLTIRPDGFAKLDELLSTDLMQQFVTAIAPEKACALNTGGNGGPVDPELFQAVLEIVHKSMRHGHPRFELWEDSVTNGQDAWIRATHKHSLQHIEVLGGPFEQKEVPKEDLPSPSASAPSASAPSASAPSAPAPPAQQKPKWTEILGDGRFSAPSSQSIVPGLPTCVSTDVNVGRFAPPHLTSPQVVPFRQPTNSHAPNRLQGKIKMFNHEKGFGFIASRDVEGDVHVRCSAFSNAPRTINKDADVEFDVSWRNNRPQASNVFFVSGYPHNQEIGGGSCKTLARSLLEVLPSDAPTVVQDYLIGLTR